MLMTRNKSLLAPLVVLGLIGVLVGSVAAADGKEIFTAQKCNMCHSVPQAELTAKVKSAKMKGPDLPNEARESEWIAGYLKRDVQLNDKDHKKEFKGTDEELQEIAAWLIELNGAE
jgi:mono/diheme cytochrome c family protein